MPSIITVLLGALAAGVVVPRLQAKIVRQSKIEDKRIEIAENILTHLNGYIVAWTRLIDISELEALLRDGSVDGWGEGLTEEENERGILFGFSHGLGRFRLC